MKHAVLHLRKNDPVLSAIIERVGAYGIQFREPGFDTLVRSIVYQQLSGKVAKVILDRLLDAVGGEMTPEKILALRPARMRKLGLSTQKTAYIRDLARHTRDGKLVFEELSALSDLDVIERLTQVKGIGVWTAQMFLMFALRRHDVLPTGDLGVRNAIKRLTTWPNSHARRDRGTGPPLASWCSVASWYLWRSLEGSASL